MSAQAVSKWENDQSCPDISLLPKLAELFGITVDELLGHKSAKVYEAEVVREDEKDEDKGITLNWEGGKTWGVAAGLTVLLTAALMIAANFMPNIHAPFWGTLWPAAMLVGGLVYMVEGFSFLKLGVAVMGGYFPAGGCPEKEAEAWQVAGPGEERQREKELFLLRAGGDLPGGEFLRGADLPGSGGQAEPWLGGSQLRRKRRGPDRRGYCQ